MSERRNFVRWQLDRKARLQLPGEEECIDCHIKDINYKGAQVALTRELKKDKYINLNITLSEDCILKLEVWVAWHKTIDGHNIYGMYFSRIKDFDKEQIYQFIRKYYPEQVREKWWDGIREDTKQEKGGETMEDRRIFERFAVNFPVNFLNLNNNKEGLAQSQDVSAKGVGFTADQELQPKTPLELWLQIPDNAEPFYTRGEVAWSKMVEPDKYKVGVNLEKADLMGLSRVLRV